MSPNGQNEVPICFSYSYLTFGPSELVQVDSCSRAFYCHTGQLLGINFHPKLSNLQFCMVLVWFFCQLLKKRCWRRQMTSLSQKHNNVAYTQPLASNALEQRSIKFTVAVWFWICIGIYLFSKKKLDLHGCLRPRGTSRKVAVSIPDGVIRNLRWLQQPCLRERTPVPVEKEAVGAPVSVCTFWNREENSCPSRYSNRTLCSP
jgi:hypothetical protein